MPTVRWVYSNTADPLLVSLRILCPQKCFDRDRCSLNRTGSIKHWTPQDALGQGFVCPFVSASGTLRWGGYSQQERQEGKEEKGAGRPDLYFTTIKVQGNHVTVKKTEHKEWLLICGLLKHLQLLHDSELHLIAWLFTCKALGRHSKFTKENGSHTSLVSLLC